MQKHTLGASPVPSTYVYAHSGATNQKTSKEEDFKDPLLVSTEQLLDEVDAFVGKVDGIDAVLDRCEVCLASLKNEDYNPLRACLVKCALARQLARRSPDDHWTQPQRLRHDTLVERVQLRLLNIDLLQSLPKNSCQAVLDTMVRQTVQKPDCHDDFVLLVNLCALLKVNLCAQMRESTDAERFSTARFLLDRLDEELVSFKEKEVMSEQGLLQEKEVMSKQGLLQLEHCLFAAYVEHFKAFDVVEKKARFLACLNGKEPKVHELLLGFDSDPIELLSTDMPKRVPAMSRLDWVVDLARCLAKKPQGWQMLFERMSTGGSRWMGLLLLARFYIVDSMRPWPVCGQSRDQDVALFIADLRDTRSIKNPRYKKDALELVLGLWIYSVAVEGAPLSNTALMLLSPDSGAASGADVIFERELTRDLLWGLPKGLDGRILAERWGESRPKVMDMAITELPLFLRIFPLRKTPATPENPQPEFVVAPPTAGWTNENLTDAAMSVGAVFRKQCQDLKNFARTHGGQVEMGMNTWSWTTYVRMVQIWAAIAERHPGWLLGLSSQHPWLLVAINRFNKNNSETAKALIEPLTRAAAENNAQAQTSLV